MATDPFLGLLMLDTRFPRPPGDIGHPQTFTFPVRRIVVDRATPQQVVRKDAAGLEQAFIDAARSLIDAGAVAIGTSCGFLGLHQQRLAAALTVPVATSSLLQCAWVEAILPRGERAGIVTIDAAALTPAHLVATSVAADAPIEGVDPGGEIARRLLNDEPTLDLARAEAEVVAAAERLLRRHPEIGAIVLECTNMPPYAAAVARSTRRPVYDVVTLLEWVWRGATRSGERGFD